MKSETTRKKPITQGGERGKPTGFVSISNLLKFLIIHRFGVALVGVEMARPGATIQLNPGPHHTLQGSDICFYLSITKEENSAFILASPGQEAASKSSIRKRLQNFGWNRNDNSQSDSNLTTGLMAGAGKM